MRAKSVQSCPILQPVDRSPVSPMSVGFYREEYGSGWPFPPPGNLPNPGIEPKSPALQADSLPSESPGKPQYHLGAC